MPIYAKGASPLRDDFGGDDGRDEPLLLYKLYESGLNNDLMSLELAIGLAWITKRRLFVYGSEGEEQRPAPSRGGRCHFVPESRRHLIDQRCRPGALDLVGPLPLGVGGIDGFPALARERRIDECQADLHELVFHDATQPCESAEGGSAEAFAEGRGLLADSPAPVWHLAGRTLAYYSRFFCDPPPGFHRLMAQVEIAAPYREFADRVARSLGNFGALHVRLTDFRSFQPRVEDRYRDEILETARALFNPSDLLVIATDESENRPFFAELLRAYPRHVFLDEWIVRGFGSEFRQLPFVDETAFGLVNRLVLDCARQFAGTPGSSFTGMVHRARLRRAVSERGSARLVGERATFRFIGSGFDDPPVAFADGAYLETRQGPYSWNRIDLPLASATKSWYREWPEAVVPVV